MADVSGYSPERNFQEYVKGEPRRIQEETTSPAGAIFSEFNGHLAGLEKAVSELEKKIGPVLFRKEEKNEMAHALDTTRRSPLNEELYRVMDRIKEIRWSVSELVDRVDL